MARKCRIVVIGGSFAGRRVERLLRNEYEVVLVDAKGFWEYHPSACRTLVEPGICRTTILPQPKSVIISTVESICPSVVTDITSVGKAGQVQLSSGESLEFDYCVICTGSSYIAPIKPLPIPERSLASKGSGVEGAEKRRNEIYEAHTTLAKAKNVVVVGGGFVGVELAAEIVGKWGKKKNVILISSKFTLLERMHERVGRYCKQWLEARGVRIFLGEKVNMKKSTSTQIVTESDKTIQADLIYQCMGFSPCILPLAEHFSSSISPSNGGVLVNSHLQVEGLKNVFAAGDCTATAEEKNALSADMAASLVVNNIQRLEAGLPLLCFPEGVCFGARAVPTIACVSLYKWHGVMQFNNLVITGRLPALVKVVIEWFQVNTALERRIPTILWNTLETLNIFLGRFLFVPSSTPRSSEKNCI